MVLLIQLHLVKSHKITQTKTKTEAFISWYQPVMIQVFDQPLIQISPLKIILRRHFLINDSGTYSQI